MSDQKLILSALAERLGLTLKAQGAMGVLDGAPVELYVQSLVAHQQNVAVYNLQTGTLSPVSAAPAQLRVTATLPFRPALDARLKVGIAGGYDVLRSTGRAGFDQRFVGPTAGRALELLTPDVKTALDAGFVGDPGVAVTDAGITFGWQRQAPYPTVEEFEAALRALPPAWHAIVGASRTLAPPEGLEDVGVWLSLVPLPGGVELRGCPVGLVGTIGRSDVSVTVVKAAGGGRLVRVRVALPEALPGAPKVVREDRFGWFDRIVEAVSGRPEILVGDREFDARFAVRTLKPEALKAALSAPVRQGLLALDKLVPTTLYAGQVEASGPVKGEEGLLAVAAATFELAHAIGAP